MLERKVGDYTTDQDKLIIQQERYVLTQSCESCELKEHNPHSVLVTLFEDGSRDVLITDDIGDTTYRIGHNETECTTNSACHKCLIAGAEDAMAISTLDPQSELDRNINPIFHWGRNSIQFIKSTVSFSDMYERGQINLEALNQYKNSMRLLPTFEMSMMMSNIQPERLLAIMRGGFPIINQLNIYTGRINTRINSFLELLNLEETEVRKHIGRWAQETQLYIRAIDHTIRLIEDPKSSPNTMPFIPEQFFQYYTGQTGFLVLPHSDSLLARKPLSMQQHESLGHILSRTFRPNTDDTGGLAIYTWKDASKVISEQEEMGILREFFTGINQEYIHTQYTQIAK